MCVTRLYASIESIGREITWNSPDLKNCRENSFPRLQAAPAPPAGGMIAVEHLSKEYQHAAVLRDVTLSVNAGECYALFGANGAGKTTLLRILATLQRPSGGRFFLGGVDGVAQRDAARQLFSMIAHGSHHYDELTALENLYFSIRLHGAKPDEDACRTVLERVGLGDFAVSRVRVFSSGMKKRLAFARAMLLRPAILFLDEPYAALDESGMALINTFLAEHSDAGGTVFMTSHNRFMTAQVAHRIGIMEGGRVNEMGVAEMRRRHELF